MPPDDEVLLTGGGSTAVHRRGDVVLRPARPWTDAVQDLLGHLADSPYTPRALGFDADGREVLAFVEGVPAPPYWPVEGIHQVGVILRSLHDSLVGYRAAGPWMPWWGRDLPSQDVILGHCDAAPWNFLARDGMPVALIDWDTAGPVGREWDVAQAAWLNCQLHDDDVALLNDLPSAADRAEQLRVFCDGYEMAPSLRSRLVDLMVELAVRTCAQEAIDAGVTPTGFAPAPMGLLGGGAPTSTEQLPWAMTWRVRGARWMLDHRSLLERALT